MANTASLVVTIDKFFFSNVEKGYGVARVTDKSAHKQLVAAGPIAMFRLGQQVSLEGEWTKHPQYGDQFKVQQAIAVRPTTTEAIVRHLADAGIAGLGRGKATAIVTMFGEKTLDVIEMEPTRLESVTGLNQEIIESLHNYMVEDRAAAECGTFMRRLGIGPASARKIHQTYKKGWKSRIESNPYQLIDDVDGIGFTIADQIATGLGFAPASPFRARAAINFVLKEAAGSSGHCGVPADELVKLASDAILQPSALIGEALNTMITDGQVINDRELVYSRSMYEAECRVAAKVRALLAMPPTFDKDRIIAALDIDEQRRTIEMHDKGTPGEFRYNEAQKDAALGLSRANMMIVTGGPGTGKTTIIKAIIGVLTNYGLEIHLASPTGRAAQRMEEATGHPAMTIHRLLEFNPFEGGFTRNEDDPLQGAVIIDETSMLDVELFDHLLRAIEPGTPLILVGDIDQLPSVGPGTVLRDLIRAGVPTQSLKQIMRQAEGSWITANAHLINSGQMPRVPVGEEGRTSDYHFIARDEAADAATQIVQLVADRLPKIRGYVERVEIIRNIQVLAPQKRGEVGVENLNKLLQQALNPDGQSLSVVGEARLRVGDKVINVKNLYDLGVFNGEIGMITGCDLQKKTIDVTFERGKDLVTVSYPPNAHEKLMLAYAITIHKAQGSEYPVCVIAAHSQHYIMLQRTLVYTALTRAKQMAVVVGQESALQRAVGNNEVAMRYGRLRERIEA